MRDGRRKKEVQPNKANVVLVMMSKENQLVVLASSWCEAVPCSPSPCALSPLFLDTRRNCMGRLTDF